MNRIGQTWECDGVVGLVIDGPRETTNNNVYWYTLTLCVDQEYSRLYKSGTFMEWLEIDYETWETDDHMKRIA